MKRVIFIISTVILTSSAVFADASMPLPDAVNSRMFSTEASRPLLNLERTHYTNKAIMQIESKQNPQKDEQTKSEPQTQEPAQKTSFKDLFKGFVIEY